MISLIYGLHTGDLNLFYVGSTDTSLEERLRWHRWEGSREKNEGRPGVKGAIHRIGPENVVIVKLATTTRASRYVEEEAWIDRVRAAGYPLENLSRGRGRTGLKHSEASRALQSQRALVAQNDPQTRAAHQKRNSSQETKRRRSQASKASWTPDRREQLSRAMKDIWTDEFRRRRIEDRNSPEWRAKESATYATAEYKRRKSESSRRAAQEPAERLRRVEQNRRNWENADFREKTSQAITKSLKARYRCAECSYENNPTHLGRHHKKSGHQGRIPLHTPQTDSMSTGT